MRKHDVGGSNKGTAFWNEAANSCLKALSTLLFSLPYFS